MIAFIAFAADTGRRFFAADLAITPRLLASLPEVFHC